MFRLTTVHAGREPEEAVLENLGFRETGQGPNSGSSFRTPAFSRAPPTALAFPARADGFPACPVPTPTSQALEIQ
jgi:hypothetical protein